MSYKVMLDRVQTSCRISCFNMKFHIIDKETLFLYLEDMSVTIRIMGSSGTLSRIEAQELIKLIESYREEVKRGNTEKYA